MSRIEELEAKIAEISAELESLKVKPEPEWVPFPGEIVEVSDGGSQWIVRKFHSMKDRRYMTHGGALWTKARPLSNPNVIQLRPHKAGDPMPCEGGERVLYRIGGGMLRMIARAGDLDWSRRIDWAPVPRVPE